MITSHQKNIVHVAKRSPLIFRFEKAHDETHRNPPVSCAEIASLPVPPPEVNTSPLGFGVGAPPGAGESSSSSTRGFGESSGASKARSWGPGDVEVLVDFMVIYGDLMMINGDFTCPEGAPNSLKSKVFFVPKKQLQIQSQSRCLDGVI